MNVPIFGIRRRVSVDEEKFLTKEDAEKEYTKKNTFSKKVQQIESTLENKITKDDLPDHSIYALKEEIPKDYLKKEDLPEPIDTSNLVKKEELEKFATKQELPDLKTYIKKENLPDFNTFAKKSELELKASIADLAKKTSIEDMEKYKGAIDENLRSKLSREEHKRDLDQKMDKLTLPDFESFAKKSDLEGLIAKDCVDLRPYAKKEDLNQYAKKDDLGRVEISYCMVKLKSDFRIYDGNDWAFEFYMGNRGNWHIINDTHKTLQKPQEYNYITPFKGVFTIDFCFTCRKDTHILKPRALQRIRSSAGEFINWQYHDIHPETVTRPNVSVLTFRNRAELLLEKGAWIKCSMQFDNRLHNHKKDWLHAVGSDGLYTPTYFSITGHKIL